MVLVQFDLCECDNDIADRRQNECAIHMKEYLFILHSVAELRPYVLMSLGSHEGMLREQLSPPRGYGGIDEAKQMTTMNT